MKKTIYEILDNGVVKRTDEDGTVWFIPPDPANSDYQAYLAYVANGNQAPTLASESAPTA